MPTNEYVKIEFSVPASIVIPFKEKFPELLKKYTLKDIITRIVKDEFLNCNDREFFNTKYYTEEDIKEIFKLNDRVQTNPN